MKQIDTLDWTYQHSDRIGVDTAIIMRIHYVGSQVAAHVSIAATTGDMTFEQGASTGAAATTTGDNPIAPVGGTTGVVDCSNAAVDTVFKLANVINAADDWEAWLVDVLPDLATEVSAGVAIFLAAAAGAADQDCTGTNGFALLLDTSAVTAQHHSAGVTNQGPNSQVHGTDRGMRHEILKVSLTATFASTAATIKFFECDDRAGTKTQIGDNISVATGSSAVAQEFGTGDTPYFAVDGHRFVAQISHAGTITVTSARIAYRSKAFAPSARKAKLYSSY